MFEKAEGTMRNVAGPMQDAFGAATGDTSTQLKGKARQAAGRAQQSYGEVLDQMRESAVANPLGTLAAAAGVGFVLGAIWARR